MRKFLYLIILAGLVACNPYNIDIQPGSEENLKGIWKLVSLRYAGGNLDKVNTLYAIVDPENNHLAFIIEGGNGTIKSPLMEMLDFYTVDDEIILGRNGKLEELRKNSETAISKIPFVVFNGNELHLYPDAMLFIPKEMTDVEPQVKNLHMELQRDTELEAKAGANTKAGDDEWMQKATQLVVNKVWTSVGDKGIDEENDFVTSPTWKNSQDWKAENWMSKLPDDMPVAWVNIPGSHDSSTTKDKMNFLANWTDAWVQTYSIEEQFNKGARYFDFRVGSEGVYSWLGLVVRAMNESERRAVEELQMYHGPLCTNTPFIGSMRMLAEKILKDKTEFVIINVQAESESDGLWSTINLEIQNALFGDKQKSEFYAAINEQSMDIANRLMKKFSREYDDEIFIPYSPNLTVGKARGHIIILQSSKNMKYECKSYYYKDGVLHDENWLRATFYSGWPDNKDGAATFYTYEKADSLVNDAYVQSYYEFGIDNKTKITRKEDAIKKLTSMVSSYNLNPGHMNVLGFDAMNANTGSATGLKTYAYAHEFNGFAYELYVDNMKDASAVPFHCGIVPMDHYGADVFANNKKVKLYGDKLSWAVIESNFHQR